MGGGKDVDQVNVPVQHKRHDTLPGGGALDRSLDKIAVKLETDFPVCVYHLTALATDCKVSFFSGFFSEAVFLLKLICILFTP